MKTLVDLNVQEILRGCVPGLIGEDVWASLPTSYSRDIEAQLLLLDSPTYFEGAEVTCANLSETLRWHYASSRRVANATFEDMRVRAFALGRVCVKVSLLPPNFKSF